jgi:hypothetical protein
MRATNPTITLQLQSTPFAGRVVELESLGRFMETNTKIHAEEKKADSDSQTHLSFKDTFEAYRSIVRSEEEQMHRRLSWLSSFQGFLFAALGLSWGKNHPLLLLICAIGIVIAVLVFTSVFAGSMALRRTRLLWNKYKPLDYDGPDIFGLYPEQPRFYHLFSSEVVIPLAFVVAWIVVLLIRERAA